MRCKVLKNLNFHQPMRLYVASILQYLAITVFAVVDIMRSCYMPDILWICYVFLKLDDREEEFEWNSAKVCQKHFIFDVSIRLP